jgi:hypothetical protein
MDVESSDGDVILLLVASRVSKATQDFFANSTVAWQREDYSSMSQCAS